MDIFLIYVIKTLLLPVSSLLLISLCGLLLINHRPQLAKRLIGLPIFSLLLLSLPITTKYLALSQEIYPPISDKELYNPAIQAIVILGGGLRKPAMEYPEHITLKADPLERVRYGALLAKKTGLPILVSGGKVKQSELPPEAEIMAKVLSNEFHQPVHWQEQQSRNTAQNAQYSAKILHSAGVKHIMLITTALHMQRAVIQFKQQGLQVTPAPTHFLSNTEESEFELLSYLPSAKALAYSSLVLHEILGKTWYKIRY